MTVAPGSPRILIVRLSALGDVIHGLPVLSALRSALPQAYLGWVVEGRAGDVLAGHPELDALIRVSRRWLKSPREVLHLTQSLRAHRFDIAVDLQCLTKSALAARLSGAGRRLGVAGADGRELSKWINNELTEIRASHVIEHYLQVLAPLGIEPSEAKFRVAHFAAAAESMENFLTTAQLAHGRFAMVNPGASWPSKIWPAERYGQLAQRLKETQALTSVAIWGTPDEHRLARTIVEHSQGTAILAPATSIQELAELSRRAALFVGSDTGPTHLSVAVGTPSISLHGTTKATWTGAYGRKHRALQARFSDGSASDRRRADDSAMRAIDVPMVLAACDELLSPAMSESDRPSVGAA